MQNPHWGRAFLCCVPNSWQQNRTLLCVLRSRGCRGARPLALPPVPADGPPSRRRPGQPAPDVTVFTLGSWHGSAIRNVENGACVESCAVLSALLWCFQAEERIGCTCAEFRPLELSGNVLRLHFLHCSHHIWLFSVRSFFGKLSNAEKSAVWRVEPSLVCLSASSLCVLWASRQIAPSPVL